jgi:hypothetical protein
MLTCKVLQYPFLGMDIRASIIDAGYRQSSVVRPQTAYLSLLYFPIARLYSGPIESPADVSALKAGPSRCNKVNSSTHRHLVNKVFENFLLLSVSSVLRDSGLSERAGKMDKRSQ